jgi:hypothetical protein
MSWLHWSSKLAWVHSVIHERKTPLGQTKMAGAPYIVAPLLLPPGVKPMRGKALKDWRLELIFKPADLPTPQWRRHMRAIFGLPLCGVRRETPNPKNPLPQSVDGWWWHGGCWTSAELAMGIAEIPVSLGQHLGSQLSVWLESAAAGRPLERPIGAQP